VPVVNFEDELMNTDLGVMGLIYAYW